MYFRRTIHLTPHDAPLLSPVRPPPNLLLASFIDAGLDWFDCYSRSNNSYNIGDSGALPLGLVHRFDLRCNARLDWFDCFGGSNNGKSNNSYNVGDSPIYWTLPAHLPLCTTFGFSQKSDFQAQLFFSTENMKKSEHI